MSCTDDGDPAVYPSVADGLAVLLQADEVYGHNIIRFDLPAIKKLYPWFAPKARIVDTFVVACMRWAHISESDWEGVKAGKYPSKLHKAPFPGSHQLEAWGIRLGCHKGDYTVWCKENGIEDPWSDWRPEMQTYCDQDVEVTRQLVLKIREAGVSAEAVEIEHELAEYLQKQEENGYPFDRDKAVEFYATLSARREELVQQLIEKFGSWKAKDGKPFVPKRDDKVRGYTKGVPVQKYKTVQFNPKSNQHIERCLREHYGWEPTSFTKSGQAEITEETLEALGAIPEAVLIHEFLTIQKRIALLAESKKKTSWLEVAKPHHVTGMHHIHGRVKQNHAITHRASHVSPNIAQVPKVGSPYGAECRELFMVPDGWVQIGADASGLELRCLSHYMAKYDGGAYGDVVLNGDIHTTNQKAAGLATRNEAKTFIYAWLYGEGDIARGAKFLPPTASKESKRRKGRKVSADFLKGLPALAKLKAQVDSKLKKQGGPGYLLLPDGRRVYIRHEHAALNSLLQGAGAIICKRWIVEFNRRLRAEFGEQGWTHKRVTDGDKFDVPYIEGQMMIPEGALVYDAPGQWAALAWVHDEVQLAVRPEIAERVAEILVESIRKMTEVFSWRIPLDGEAKMGPNWKATH